MRDACVRFQGGFQRSGNVSRVFLQCFGTRQCSRAGNVAICGVFGLLEYGVGRGNVGINTVRKGLQGVLKRSL